MIDDRTNRDVVNECPEVVDIGRASPCNDKFGKALLHYIVVVVNLEDTVADKWSDVILNEVERPLLPVTAPPKDSPFGSVHSPHFQQVVHIIAVVGVAGNKVSEKVSVVCNECGR